MGIFVCIGHTRRPQSPIVLRVRLKAFDIQILEIAGHEKIAPFHPAGSKPAHDQLLAH